MRRKNGKGKIIDFIFDGIGKLLKNAYSGARDEAKRRPNVVDRTIGRGSSPYYNWSESVGRGKRMRRMGRGKLMNDFLNPRTIHSNFGPIPGTMIY